MTLASLSREAVLAAVAEFDDLGRSTFLAASGFSKAKSYFLEWNERLSCFSAENQHRAHHPVLQWVKADPSYWTFLSKHT